jgi:cytoplasmic FMR1 interacting protein
MSVTSSIFEREKGSEEDVTSLIANPEVLISEMQFMRRIDLADDVPNIQSAPSSINVEIASASNAFADHQGYFTTFAQEMDFIAKMESLSDKGMVLINMLYSYRSVSQAIPEISIEIPPDATVEQQSGASAKRGEINRKILDILRPEVIKVKDLISYLIQAVSLFHSVITHLTNKEATKEAVPEGIHASLLRLMDTLLILDTLKDLKTCLQKDFSRYKRVVGAHPSIEILEEVTQLQTFLSNPDPRKAKNYILLSLRDEVKRVNGHENVLLDGLEYAMDALERGLYVTPEEQFRLLRVLPYYILMADGEADDPKSFNIFKTSRIKLPALQKLFKRFPVVPLFADTTLVLEYVLHRSVHYTAGKYGSSWGDAAFPTAPIPPHYDLRASWPGMRDSYSTYVTRFSAAINRYEKYPFQKALDDVSVSMSASVYALVTDGLQLVARWSGVVRLMLSWKYSHPCTAEHMAQLQALGSEGISGGFGTTVGVTAEGSEYARVLRYNLSREELSVLVDAVCMIKSVAALMTRAEATLSSYLRFHVHHRVQCLVQGEMTPLLHRLDKRNKPILPTLLSIRALVADWSEDADPLNLYKEFSRKQVGSRAVHTSCINYITITAYLYPYLRRPRQPRCGTRPEWWRPLPRSCSSCAPSCPRCATAAPSCARRPASSARRTWSGPSWTCSSSSTRTRTCTRTPSTTCAC